MTAGGGSGGEQTLLLGLDTCPKRRGRAVPAHWSVEKLVGLGVEEGNGATTKHHDLTCSNLCSSLKETPSVGMLSLCVSVYLMVMVGVGLSQD